MDNILIATLFFLFGYVLNMFYITVFYHRALTHRALTLRPGFTKFLGATGTWITGLEPLAWAAMHRLHHQHSDTAQDPHSPTHQGLFGVWVGQYRVYKSLVEKLKNHSDPETTRLVSDIPLGVSFLNRHNLSNLPYLLHGLIAGALTYFFGSFIIGIAYFLGIMSHPIQGWMVNALAHRFGHRNFALSDDSRNNLFVAYFVFGEGLQNNHHAHPHRANFSHHFFELDMGYWMCWWAEKFQILKINR